MNNESNYATCAPNTTLSVETGKQGQVTLMYMLEAWVPGASAIPNPNPEIIVIWQAHNKLKKIVRP